MVESIVKVPSGIHGFDHVSIGGIPAGRTTLVSGSAGSGKTIFVTQFLVQGVRDHAEAAVFVTFEESPDDIMANTIAFGWPIERWVEEGKWTFINASPSAEAGEVVEAGPYDFSGLLISLADAVKRTGATRVAFDSIGAIFAQFPDPAVVRRELFRIMRFLKDMGVTTLISAERGDQHSYEVARYGVEEFVADNVIVLRNVLEAEKRRRTLEILKYRGTPHQKGEFPFTVLPAQGIQIIPLSAMELIQKSSDRRVPSGSKELDEMCGGGFFQNSIILVSGATGTGKTLLSTHFVAGGIETGERTLLLAYEESREQLFRNATGWGMDFERMEQSGQLKVVCTYPEIATLEDHLINIQDLIEAFKPQRLAFDSLSAMERVSTEKSFREFVISLTSYIKQKEILGLFTSTTSTLMGGSSITETHISTITDSIILLRYVEAFGEMKRGMMVLKMRGSGHNKEIREFTIDGHGLHMGPAFRNATGILSGQPRYFQTSELDRLNDLFREGFEHQA